MEHRQQAKVQMVAAGDRADRAMLSFNPNLASVMHHHMISNPAAPALLGVHQTAPIAVAHKETLRCTPSPALAGCWLGRSGA